MSNKNVINNDSLPKGRRTYLCLPMIEASAEFLSAVKESMELHHPWVSVPSTREQYEQYLERIKSESQYGFMVRSISDGQLIGVVNLSEIVRGCFQSGYLGFYAFKPFSGQGLMSEGVSLVLDICFRVLKLHRLEANVQPANAKSKNLIKKLNFRLEGFSPNYLNIDGQWRDHERYALILDDYINVCASYEKIAHWYDSRRDYLYEQVWLDRFLSHLKPMSHILDIGCGMGEPIDTYFLDRNFKVTGIDGCKKMIELALQRVPQGKFLFSDMRELRMTKKYDAIIAWNSLFHLPKDDQKKMFITFAQHLNNQGILMFTTGSESGEIWSDNGGEYLYHASLSPEEYKELIEEYGFELIDYKINDKECNGHTIWLVKYGTQL